MAIRQIITLPDPLLREVSTPIETISEEILALADDMLETMYDAPGVGLAAVQVGVPKRLIVLDVADDEDTPKPVTLINPEIIKLGDVVHSHEEGCLSIPDVLVDIERPSLVIIRYMDRDGVERQLEADGLLATAIQHEVDHLDGKMIIDFLSRLKRDMVVRKFKKLARGDATA